MTITNMLLFMGILSMCFWRKNIILMLLSLELILISLFTSMVLSLSILSLLSLMFMLIMMVSSSSIGISLLVSLSHTHNSSNSMFINLLTYYNNHNKIMYMPLHFINTLNFINLITNNITIYY